MNPSLKRRLCWAPLLLLLANCLSSPNQHSTPSSTQDALDSQESEPPVDSDQTTEDTPADEGLDQQLDQAVEDTPPDRVLRHGMQGEIVCVIDGDTVHLVVQQGWYHRIRMLGINAPECDKTRQQTPNGWQYVCSADQEYWGLPAGLALTELALNQTVTVHCDGNPAPGDPCETDQFDRYLAYLESDQWDLSEYQARFGHAFAFTAFSDTSRLAIYCQAEDLARSENLGMWAFGSRAEVLELMNESTRGWYRYRDQICNQLTQ